MGLRCLLGHDFDEPEIEREREEDGKEVVTTVREVKTCSRCGETQIVSENTEVTTVERLADHAAAAAGDPTEPEQPTPADASGTGQHDVGGSGSTEPIAEAEGDADGAASRTDSPATTDTPSAGGDPGAVDDAGASGPTDGTATTAGEAADDGAEIIDAGPADGSGDDPVDGDAPAATAEPTGSDVADADAGGADVVTPDAAPEATGSTEPDDGVILDDEAAEDAPDRDRGAWPDVDEEEESVDDPTPWPEPSGEDEGFDAEFGGGDSGVEFGGGLTPESADEPVDVDDETEFVEAPDANDPAGRIDSRPEESGSVDTGIARGESPELRTRGEEAATEYYCPSCEMTRPADGNSMRAGDICPECKRGYVDERPR